MPDLVTRARTHHVGYYLLDRGSRTEAKLNYQPSQSVRLRDWVFAHPTRIYLGSIAPITLALLFVVVLYQRSVEAPIGQVIAGVLIALIPASSSPSASWIG